MSSATVAVSAPTYSPFIESDAAASPEALRAAMEEQGYLFFRGLVPAPAILEVRRTMLEYCAEAGWLDPSRPLMDAVASAGPKPSGETDPEYMATYRKVLHNPLFQAFPEQPNLMAAAEALLGDDVFIHPRRIGRITFPNNPGAATPPHQDHFYIRGAVETYSCWIPLGECPISLGALAIWPGSRHRGFIEHTAEFPGATGGRGVPVDEAEAQWHVSDFEIGDTLFFHSYTIHKAMPNLSPDRLRLSTDNRYQHSRAEIHPGALKTHFAL